MAKNKKSIKNFFRNDVLIDETYDGFKDFVNDGRDQSRYTNFRVAKILKLFGFIKPEKDECVIVIDRLNPDKVEVLGTGLYFTSLKKKYLYVPRPPESPIIVDFVPKNEQDKKMNFTFTPNLVGGLTDGQDEIFIDYRIHLKWSGDYKELDEDKRMSNVEESVLKYYYSVNPMQNIQATIVSLLREFVARNTKDKLMSEFSAFGLKDIDPGDKLQHLADKYGLDIIDFDVKNIKLSDAVQQAKNRASESIEEANARKKTAKIARETAQINAEANMAGFREGVKFASEDMGFSTNDPRTLYLLKLLNDREIAEKAKAYIAGDSSKIDLKSWAALNSFKGMGDKSSGYIDATYTEVPEEGRGRKR